MLSELLWGDGTDGRGISELMTPPGGGNNRLSRRPPQIWGGDLLNNSVAHYWHRWMGGK